MPIYYIQMGHILVQEKNDGKSSQGGLSAQVPACRVTYLLKSRKVYVTSIQWGGRGGKLFFFFQLASDDFYCLLRHTAKQCSWFSFAM